MILDAGHGGEDGGAVGVNGALEKDLNLAVAQGVAALLREKGVAVILTREEDRALAWQRQVESGPVAEFPPSSVYRQEGAQTLYLTELWIKAEDADNPAYYYGKDEAGTWWTLRVIWHNSREEYQAYQHEASGFPERLEQEAFLQIK